MTSSTTATISSLLLHAGLPRTSEDTDDLSIILWDLKKSRYTAIDDDRFQFAVENVLELLQKLNSELLVERQATPPRDRSLSEPLVYAMSGIILSICTSLRAARTQHATPEVEQLLISAAERIAYCWDQCIAGDIDDLRDSLNVHELTSNCGRDHRGQAS